MINYDFSPTGKKKIPCGIGQLLRIMKLTSLLLLAVCLHLSAETRSQTVSLNIKKQPIEKVFQAIEKQTELMVIFNDRLVNRSTPVSIQVNDMPLTQTLETLLRPISLTYQITENTIVITGPPVSRRNEPVRSFTAKSQQQLISGQITDDQGNLLQGVTVSVKGTTTATTTDATGQYQLTLPETGSTLVFTLVGYHPVEHLITDATNTVNISMTPAVSDLDEVVVVAY